MTNPTSTTPPQPDVKPTPLTDAVWNAQPYIFPNWRETAHTMLNHAKSLERQLSDHAQLLPEKDAEIARLKEALTSARHQLTRCRPVVTEEGSKEDVRDCAIVGELNKIDQVL